MYYYDKVLSNRLLMCGKYGVYDFLHGGSGIAYYFATIKNNNWSKVLCQYLECLYKSREVTSSGAYRWQIETLVNGKSIGRVYNLSLSHGMASFVALFLKVIEKDSNDLALDLLHGTLRYFKEVANTNDDLSFPKWIEPITEMPITSNYSWCYGDPGISQVLYRASRFLDEKELEEISENALLKDASCKCAERIRDVCFCHGSSGLCHIFTRCKYMTMNNAFDEAVSYWSQDILEKGNCNSMNAGYVFNGDGNEDRLIGLLDGLAGVGLSLLSCVEQNNSNWDECVLLS